MQKAGMRIGYFDSTTKPYHRDLVLDLMELACEPYCTEGCFDFGNTDLAARIRDKGFEPGRRPKILACPAH